MATVTIEDIQRLRALTGVGITDAKRALQDADGDFDTALREMRKKGLTKAEKKGEREAREGIVDAYVHSNRIAVIVEVNSETDFMARTDDFKAFVHDIAMQIAASAPEYVSLDAVPAAVRDAVKAECVEKVKAEGKPDAIVDQIVEGMLTKYFAERCLLEQPFIKNPDQTVGDYLKEHIAKLGENIVVRRFHRIALGEVA